MVSETRKIVLAKRPASVISADDFQMVSETLGRPGDGEVLVRNLWMSVDPYMRLYLGEQNGLHASLPIGEVLTGGAVGQVVESQSSDLPCGSFVISSTMGWREHYIAPAEMLTALAADFGPLQRYLGIYGLTGITAFAGIRHVLKPRSGETLFVSGAAGAVGSVAVQLGKIAGARVIGTAGSDEKGRWLTESLGVDAFINYRTEDVASRLAELAPEGLDMVFDNVGGAQLEITIDAMKPKGRIALCGAIAQYEDDNYRAGPANLFATIEKHISITGFNAGFYYDRAPEIISELSGLIDSGRLIWQETIVEGLESAPVAFADMLGGANKGKMLVKLGEPS
ncbi:MAG: NADP-dependent oxidoreductase [Parasphingorhabdus sp.]